jgi:hypothetical protein
MSYQTGRGPRAVVLSYAVTGDAIMFLLPEYNEICQYAPGRPIAMRVSALTPDESITEVVVTGIGHLLETGLADTVEYPEHWPLGVSTHTVCLDLVNLEGSTWQAEPVLVYHPLSADSQSGVGPGVVDFPGGCRGSG